MNLSRCACVNGVRIRLCMPKHEVVPQGWTPLHVATCHKEHVVQLLASNVDKVQSLLQHSKQCNCQHIDLKYLGQDIDAVHTHLHPPSSDFAAYIC